MHVLIENSETLEYLTNVGNWSKIPSSGRRFSSKRDAFQTAKLEAIGKFNIVWHNPTTNQFVNLDHGRGKGLLEVEEGKAEAAATA